MDWNESPINYTCYHPKEPFPILESVKSIQECQNVPKGYYVRKLKNLFKKFNILYLIKPQHYCMIDPVKYNETLPTHGDHRPLWPVFGEYKFVPPQRWLHNIEV